MKIVIVGSIEHADKIIKVSDQLELMGHKTEIPHSCVHIQKGDYTLDEYKKWKRRDGGDYKFRKNSKTDFIKAYFDYIKKSDVILVLNITKNKIRNYIGGNALMELGFAHVLGKPIYLYNPIPKMAYSDEIKAVNPKVINRDLKKLNRTQSP